MSFFAKRSDLGEIEAAVVNEVEKAKNQNLFVSVRAEDFNGEVVLYGEGVYVFTLEQYQEYIKSGGTWTYVHASEWLNS